MNLPNNQPLVRELAQFSKLNELKSSSFYAACGFELDQIVTVPQTFSPPLIGRPNQEFLRVVCWNIERGNRFEAVKQILTRHSLLSTADVLLLNEVDVGMIRTGNRHVGFELAEATGMHCVYGAEYLEITKGIGEELNLPGENTTALHGNAILSRYPLEQVKMVQLPVCFEPFHFPEKRYGSRIALYSEIELPRGQRLSLVTAHLEVRDTPACRGHQMQFIMDWLSNNQLPVIFGGDWNTNTFARGTRWRTAKSTARVLFTEPNVLQHTLKHPDNGEEPLFAVLRNHGFEWRNLNDDQPTCSVPLANMEDAALIPGIIRSWITRRIEQHSGHLHMRLDWIASRGICAATPGRTVTDYLVDGRPASDHAPIVVDLKIGE